MISTLDYPRPFWLSFGLRSRLRFNHSVVTNKSHDTAQQQSANQRQQPQLCTTVNRR